MNENNHIIRRSSENISDIESSCRVKEALDVTSGDFDAQWWLKLIQLFLGFYERNMAYNS